MAERLTDVFPTPDDLLQLEPEELAGALLEVIPAVSQHAGFTFSALESQFYPLMGHGAYPRGRADQVAQALAEALGWLQTQGLIVKTPGQPADWWSLTRRARALRTRVDLATYRLGRALPVELLQPALAQKVHHLFLRGDHDVAVFQAFKEVEVAVRKAGGYGDGMVGRDLMQAAFHPETGPLTDKSKVKAEREAEMFLFVGAIGHAKNPASHREVGLERSDAARLIVFASHLLDITSQRPI
jgi:uncharacterized protein (TIGR02391 family)